MAHHQKTSWFEKLTGFPEKSYRDTLEKIEVDGDRLRSKVNGKSYGIGRLETPSLQELRERVAALGPSPYDSNSYGMLEADVYALHSLPEAEGALFQVASQFNLLEMSHFDVTPEAGITRYQYDATQGPACAMATGAATLYRNYFAPVKGEFGQTQTRQINTLEDIASALGVSDSLEVRNGYALATKEVLKSISAQLNTMSLADKDALRAQLRIGLHSGVEVTTQEASGQSVSLALCSALPIAYTRVPSSLWEPFARLVLDAAYEATLLAAILNAQVTGNRRVYVTSLGGGAFGNEEEWISGALMAAVRKLPAWGINVLLVKYPRHRYDEEDFESAETDFD